MAGLRPRLHANLQALRTLRTLQAESRPATADEQRVLAHWSGWGAIAQQAFHPSYAHEYSAEQTELRTLLDRREYAAARRSTLNAHYTDASLVQAIWGAVQDLGVRGGTVLEPGCGSGNFLGFAPEGVHMLGVELDPTTAAISSLLYPHAQVRNESFAETVSPDSVFDAAVGNVPFGDHTLYDSRHNPERLSIHNHFIVKSLDLVKPGGVVAMITSHHTMDNQSTAARSQITQRADVLGVVRLPSSAHRSAAGTKVVTDVVVLRKRSAGEPPAHLGSITDGLRDVGAQDPDCDVPVWANSYFDEHPEHVLGQVTWCSGQFGPELDVVGPSEGLGERLRTALDGIVQSAHEQGLSAVSGAEKAARVELADLASAQYEGLLQVDAAGQITKMRLGRPEPHLPSRGKAELVKLLRMRDTVRDLLDAQNTTAVETPHIVALRQRLNTQYDAYVAAHGYINRRSVNKNGVSSPPFQGGFRRDPLSAYVYGLERYDTQTHTAEKMEVFRQRVLNPGQEITRAESPQDALYVCLREIGHVDLNRIADLLGARDTTQAREALGELVFTDPADGRLISAPEYLSGDVRAKLQRAREAAELDPALRPNVRALEDVQRPELTAAEIIPQLGAAWIDDAYVQQFAREVLENDQIVVEHAGHNVWSVSDHGKDSSLATEMFGTKRRSANDLLQLALSQNRVEVFDTVRDGGGERRVLNQEATDAARAKVDEIRERFSEWTWEDPDRTAELVEHYNATYNSVRLRSYDDEVDLDRDFPGLAADSFEPRHHQIAAVERILAEPTTLLAHGTGAGKTSEMIMAAMEMRRLGQARKPALVVPNNVIEQFASEFAQRYPGARVLVADKKKMEGKYRKEFLSQVAMGDWDAVIFTHQQFEKIPMGFEVRKAYLEQEVEHLESWYEGLVDDDASRANVKQAERMLIKARERLARHLDGNHDVGMPFEHTGIDALLVDEAHLFKNATVRSNILDAAKEPSARADDMMMKFDYLRERDGKLVMATATPVANSVSELWVFLRYLYPQWLRERGLEDFDRWASTFGLVETVAELDEANELRQRERFSKFRNVPELLLAWATITDAKTKEELGLPEPLVRWLDEQGVWQDGPRTVVVPPSPEQVRYHEQQIKTRMKALRSGKPQFMGYKIDKNTGEREEVHDNTLWVGNHAAANSLDRRLAPDPPAITPLAMADLRRAVQEMEQFNKLDPLQREERMALYRATLDALASGSMSQEQTPEWFNAMALGLTKTDVAAQMIHQAWEENKDRRFLDRRTGELHERPGAFQMVFCDSGVWNKSKDADQYTVYTDLRERLVAMGMPREKIRFLQEADGDDRKKAELFEACRDGRISVLVGTTVGMGVGTNAQDRAVHLLHMDCPWRPVDIEQRDGRVVRQHNQNESVQITRLVTAESADALRWSTNARKAGFIGQILRSQVTEREIEDIDPQQADFGVTAAMSANNPRQQALALAQQKLNAVERAYKSWSQSRAASHQTLRWAPARIKEAEAFVDDLDGLLARRVSTQGTDFAMRIAGQSYTKRKEAGEALREAVKAAVASESTSAGTTQVEVAELGGLPITARIMYNQAGAFTVALGFPEIPSLTSLTGTRASVLVYESRQELDGANPVTMCTRLERPLTEMERTRAEYTALLQKEKDRQRQAQANLERPFTKKDRLVELTREVEGLEAELGLTNTEQRQDLAQNSSTGGGKSLTTADASTAPSSAHHHDLGPVEPASQPSHSTTGPPGPAGERDTVTADPQAPAPRDQPSSDWTRHELATKEAITKLEKATGRRRPAARDQVTHLLKQAQPHTDDAMMGHLVGSARLADPDGPWDKPDQLIAMGLLPAPSEPVGTTEPTPARPVRDRGAAAGERKSVPDQRESGSSPQSTQGKESALERARAALDDAINNDRGRRSPEGRKRSAFLRVRLHALVQAVENGEADREVALELFSQVNRLQPDSVYATEVWRQRIAVPSIDSEYFNHALVVRHQDQTSVRVPAHLIAQVRDLLLGHGFQPDSTQLEWALPGGARGERERTLNELLQNLDSHPGVERMRQDYADRLQERPTTDEASLDWHPQDEALRERVNALIADSDLRQAWEEVSTRLAHVREAEGKTVSNTEIAAFPVGHLRARVLAQARLHERSLDEERARQGQLTPEQREAFEHRYRRLCPHLNPGQIRTRMELSPEGASALREAYGTLENLSGAQEALSLRGHRQRLHGAMEVVAQAAGAEHALTVLAAANTADPAGALDREILRTGLVLDTAAPRELPVLAFDQHASTPEVYVSTRAPQHVRQLLRDQGWTGLGGPMEPMLALYPDGDLDREGQLEEQLMGTIVALDALPEPVMRVNADLWRQKREDLPTFQVLVDQEPDLFARVDALVQDTAVRRAAHLVVEAYEQRWATARVEEISNESLLDKYAEVILASVEHERELNTRLANPSSHDIDVRLELAGQYWDKCPHLRLDEIATRIGQPMQNLTLSDQDTTLHALEQGVAKPSTPTVLTLPTSDPHPMQSSLAPASAMEEPDESGADASSPANEEPEPEHQLGPLTDTQETLLQAAHQQGILMMDTIGADTFAPRPVEEPSPSPKPTAPTSEEPAPDSGPDLPTVPGTARGPASDPASAAVPGEEAAAERLAARWAMRQRRSANSIERGLGPSGDFMSGPRRALMVQALWALGGPLQSRFGGGARYALELGEKKFLGKVTREEEQWAYDYTRTHPDFTRERTWEEIESVTQAALRYNDPATALRMIDNYDGRSTNSLAIQMREQIIAECTEQVKNATREASWAIGHLDPEGAWAALQRSRPHAEALQDTSPADEARPGMLWKAARKIVLAARELSHQDATPQTPTAVPSWRTEDRQVGSGRQAPVIITPGGHVLGMVANQRQAERVLAQTVNLPSTPALPVKDDLTEALEVYRDAPSWHHAQRLGQLTVKAAGQSLIDMALRINITATEHAPHEQQGWWNSNRSQVRAASGRALFTDITASTEDASTTNTPAQEDSPTKSQARAQERSEEAATSPHDDVTDVPREDSSVPIVNGPPPGGWTDADRITPRTEPEFALEPDTDPGERAAAAIEGIGSNHRFTKEASTFWDGLDQALTDLSAQGRHQEVVDNIARVREQNHHDWWRWETHRSRAVAALNPDIIDRALLLHYARTDNSKAETHLYGVTKSDKGLHRLLKRSPFNFNHKVTENRWQVDPRWGWDKHEPRLRALMRHFDEQGITYLSQQVHDELVEQRSKSVQTEPKTDPVTAPQTRQDTSKPGENPPRSAPTMGTEEQITVTEDGHVGEIHGVLKAPQARVKVLSEFTYRSGPQAGEPGWRAVYDLGGGREVMQWHTERPDITQGQTLTDFVAKVRRHTWYNPGRGRPRQAQTEVVVAPPRGEVFPLTTEQEKIVEHAMAGDLMVVQAGAGTGKTSTSTRIAEALTEQGRRGIYTVYGRANADEAIVKLAHVPVQADTLHAIARAAVGGPYSQRLGAKAPRPDPLASMHELQVGGLDLAGGTYLGPKTLYRILDKALREFEKSADLHISANHIHLPGYNPTDTAAVRAHLAPVLDQAWADIADPNGHLFRFEHDSYVKIFHLTGGRIEVGGQGRGFVIIDEAQDMNKVAEAILRAQAHLQLIWVGDSAQAIHGWRGAIDALERQQPDVTLSLSKSFRFGPQVAEHANRYLEALDAPLRLEGNPALDSVVQDESVADPDMILCRTNAGVFTEATYQLDQGRTVGIIGGTQDLSNLVKAAEELRTEGYTEHPDLSHFASWKQVVEVARESPEDLEQLAPFVRVIDTRGASEVRDYLARMSDTDPDVWLSTAHRSKGLEEDVVQIGGDFKAKTATESEVSEAEIAAELRLKYVAVTRAKAALGLGSLADDPDLGVATTPTDPHTESSVREPTPASGPDQGEAQTTPKPDTAHTDAVPEPQNEEQTPKVSAQPKQTPTAQQAEQAEGAPTDGAGKAIEGPSARDESNPEPTEAARPTRDALIDVGAESITSIPLEGEIKETNYIAELRQIARDLPEELRLALTPQDPTGPRGGMDWSQTPVEHLDTLQERGLAMTDASGERYLTQRGYNVSRLLNRMLTGPDTALLTPTSDQKPSDPKEAFDHGWVPRLYLHGELEPGPGLERVRELADSLRPKHLRAMDRGSSESRPNRMSLAWDSTPDKHMRELRDLEIVFRERGRWWFTHLGEAVHDLLWRHKYGPEKGLPIIERSSSAAAPVSAQQSADEEPQPTLFAAEPEPRSTPVTPAEDHDEPAPTQTPTAGEDPQEEPKMSETPEQKGPPSPEPDIRQLLQSLENQDELWSQVRQEDGSWVYAIGAPGPNQQRYTAEELRQHFLTSNQTHETSPQAEDEQLRQALQEATGQTWNTFYDNGPEARYSTGADPDQSEWLTAEQARAHLQEITSTSTFPTAEEPATEQAPAQAENEQASVSATDLYDDLADLPENDATGAEQDPAPHDPPADASQENETPPPPETEPEPELGPDMDHALGEANFGRGPLAQEQPRLEVQLGEDPENEPDQDQKQKNLHIALGESHTDTGTNTSTDQESNDAYGPGQGSVETLPQAARQEQPHTIDGRDLRMNHGWHKTLDKSDYVTAASEVDPLVYQDMRKKLSKALDSGNDVKLVLPSNDPDQVRAFIDMAKERGYQVTLSARIDPNAQRAIDGAQAITDHLVNGSVHHAIPSEYARKEQRRLQQILTECDQDKLVDRIDLYPRTGADPAVSKRLIGDRTPEGQLTGATWNMRSSIAEEIKQLRSVELSPQEAQRIRQQMHSIYEQLPGEEKLRSEGEVRARTEVVDALNYLASDQGLAPLDPDSARNVDISGHDPLVDHHGGPEKTSEEHPPPPEEPPYPEKEHTAPEREPAMAGAGPTSPPTREEALAAAHTPDSGAVRRPPSSPKPTPTAPGNGPVTHSRVRGPRP